MEYQTTARLNLDTGTPVAVTYGPISEGAMFSTITCANCRTKLDIDNTLSGEAAQEAFSAFMTARYRADILATDLPSVTVRTRGSEMRPVRMPGQQGDRSECTD